MRQVSFKLSDLPCDAASIYDGLCAKRGGLLLAGRRAPPLRTLKTRSRNLAVNYRALQLRGASEATFAKLMGRW